MLGRRIACLLALALGLSAALGHAAEKKILVYTRNYTAPPAKGFVHDNIKAGVEAIKKLGAENGFAVDAGDDPKVFTTENLKLYAALVFANSNNEAFENDAQREAFKKYIQGGGGFVGIHSASGSERAWDYYWKVLGGKFKFHPAQQPLAVKCLEPGNPITAGLPAEFTWSKDECYHHTNLNPDIKVVLEADPQQVPDKRSAEAKDSLVNGMIPLVWYHNFDGGREVYIALGHNIPQYQDPILTRLMLNGIKWAMGEKSVAPAAKAGKKAEKEAQAGKGKGKGKRKKA